MTDHAEKDLIAYARWALGLMSAVLAVFSLMMFLAWSGWWGKPKVPPRHEPTEAQMRWVAERHRYHGIWSSVEENGVRYFVREGKKCRL